MEGLGKVANQGKNAYLRGLYGDYMRLPPENQRVSHGMKVWKA